MAHTSPPLDLASDRPLILLSNDDGIDANGLAALAAALDGLGTVAVVAPSAGGAVTSSTAWALFIAGLLGFSQAMFSTTTLHDVLLAMLPLLILVAGQMLVLLMPHYLSVALPAAFFFGVLLTFLRLRQDRAEHREDGGCHDGGFENDS